MSLFEWNDTYIIGVQQFDEHHQHLVALLNTSFDAFERNAPPRELETIIDQLIRYATYHFEAEESWLAQQTYPELIEHTGEHASFTAKMASFQLDLMAGNATLNHDLFSFLSDWLVTHILESDARYGRFIAEKDQLTATL